MAFGQILDRTTLAIQILKVFGATNPAVHLFGESTHSSNQPVAILGRSEARTT